MLLGWQPGPEHHEALREAHGTPFVQSLLDRTADLLPESD